jgi:hypothetical protein
LSERLPSEQTVSISEHQFERHAEPAISMESDHEMSEYDVAKQQTPSVEWSQHQTTYESAVKIPSQTEHKDVEATQDFEEITSESAVDTKKIPIKRVATEQEESDEYLTAESKQQPGKLSEHTSEIYDDIHKAEITSTHEIKQDRKVSSIGPEHELELVKEPTRDHKIEATLQEFPSIQHTENIYQTDSSQELSHQEELVKEPTRDHKIEATLQEFPSIQHTENIQHYKDSSDLSHQEELVKEPTRDHKIEATLQEFPSIQHTEKIYQTDSSQELRKSASPETPGSDRSRITPG